MRCAIGLFLLALCTACDATRISELADSGASGSGGTGADNSDASVSGGNAGTPGDLVDAGEPILSDAARAGAPGVGDAAVVADSGEVDGAMGDASATYEDGDTLPWRPLQVTAPPADYAFTFQPSDADPQAVEQDGNQVGRLDTRVTPLGKLVVDMGARGGSNMAWFPRRGFHFMAIDFMGVGEVPSVVGRGADFYGDVRLEALTGEDRVPDIAVSFYDSFEGHVTYGLAYLHSQFPDQDWGYYLNQDGSVRWSDVIVTGSSHGASSTARFAKVRRLWRAVSRSGPRDNTCGEDPECTDGVVATWFSEESQTPIDRYFSISGTADGQFPEIQYALQAIGYVGMPVNVEDVPPPYEGSRRLISYADHMGFCNEGAQWDDACNYMFGVPPENQ